MRVISRLGQQQNKNVRSAGAQSSFTADELTIRAPENTGEIFFRLATDLDMPFVFSTWLKNFRDSAHPHLARPDYFAGEHRLIELLVSRGAAVLLACDCDDATQLLGWICHEVNTVHYLYVKQVFRKLGIGRKLLSQAGIKQPFRVTHWTPSVSMLRHKAAFVFDPYLLIERELEK